MAFAERAVEVTPQALPLQAPAPLLHHLLFGEMVHYALRRAGEQGLGVEQVLKAAGRTAGARCALLLMAQERPWRLIPDKAQPAVLQLILGPLWKLVFGAPAARAKGGGVEVVRTGVDEYHITDRGHLFTRFCTPNVREVGLVQVGAFTAGLIEGVVVGAWAPGAGCEVTAYFTDVDEASGTARDYTSTTFVVQLRSGGAGGGAAE